MSIAFIFYYLAQVKMFVSVGPNCQTEISFIQHLRRLIYKSLEDHWSLRQMANVKISKNTFWFLNIFHVYNIVKQARLFNVLFTLH